MEALPYCSGMEVQHIVKKALKKEQCLSQKLVQLRKTAQIISINEII
ncbi:MAG: hypothetical protein ACJAXY_001457 [Nonlabens sp.]|jgi:hypothetical protein